MPRFDKTGPLGEGAMTGRGLGSCVSGKAASGGRTARYAKGIGMGLGLGLGYACRRAFGFGRGFARNFAFNNDDKSQKEILSNQKDFLQSQIDDINKRLDEL